MSRLKLLNYALFFLAKLFLKLWFLRDLDQSFIILRLVIKVAFIPSRNIVEYILVLEEIIYSLNHMHGKKGFVISKIDMKKSR